MLCLNFSQQSLLKVKSFHTPFLKPRTPPSSRGMTQDCEKQQGLSSPTAQYVCPVPADTREFSCLTLVAHWVQILSRGPCEWPRCSNEGLLSIFIELKGPLRKNTAELGKRECVHIWRGVSKRHRQTREAEFCFWGGCSRSWQTSLPLTKRRKNWINYKSHVFNGIRELSKLQGQMH